MGGKEGVIKLGGQNVVDLSGHVHHLPCCIKFTGPSDVSHYFKPNSTGIEVNGLAVEEAFFRGRRLQGTRVSIPQGYSGFVLGKNSKDNCTKRSGKNRDLEVSEDRSDCWETLAKCESMTFWNHDSLPSPDDASVRLFHWFSVAKALHEPVTEGDLAATSK